MQHLRILVRVMSRAAESVLYVIVGLLAFLTVVTASVAYLFESPQCMEWAEDLRCDSHFRTIPHAFWWALITLTTVGYGDMVPSTSLGKVAGGLTAFSGVIVVAIAAALISIHVRERFAQEKMKPKFRSRAVGPEVRCVERLVSEFQGSLDRLVAGINSAALRQNSVRVQDSKFGDCPPCARASQAPVKAMLRSIKSHASAISDEIHAYVDEVILESGGKATKKKSHRTVNATGGLSIRGMYGARLPSCSSTVLLAGDRPSCSGSVVEGPSVVRSTVDPTLSALALVAKTDSAVAASVTRPGLSSNANPPGALRASAGGKEPNHVSWA